MSLIEMPTALTIIVDIVAWLIIQPSVAILAQRLPASMLDHSSGYLRLRRWEGQGDWYGRWLCARRWTRHLPDGAAVIPGAFSLRVLQSSDPAYLRLWVRESCRAELSHALSIPPALLFFLWNPFWVGIAMVAYAVVFNLPMIVAQRHNRGRVLATIARLQSAPRDHSSPPDGSGGKASSGRDFGPNGEVESPSSVTPIHRTPGVLDRPNLLPHLQSLTASHGRSRPRASSR